MTHRAGHARLWAKTSRGWPAPRYRFRWLRARPALAGPRPHRTRNDSVAGRDAHFRSEAEAALSAMRLRAFRSISAIRLRLTSPFCRRAGATTIQSGFGWVRSTTIWNRSSVRQFVSDAARWEPTPTTVAGFTRPRRASGPLPSVEAPARPRLRRATVNRRNRKPRTGSPGPLCRWVLRACGEQVGLPPKPGPTRVLPLPGSTVPESERTYGALATGSISKSPRQSAPATRSVLRSRRGRSARSRRRLSLRAPRPRFRWCCSAGSAGP